MSVITNMFANSGGSSDIYSLFLQESLIGLTEVPTRMVSVNTNFVRNKLWLWWILTRMPTPVGISVLNCLRVNSSQYEIHQNKCIELW